MKLLYSPAFCLAFMNLIAQNPDKDSVHVAKNERKSKSTLNTRLHTMGQFSFSGRIISPNPALDFFYNYDSKQWGLSLFKAFDLYDHTTSNNFGLVMVRKNFHIGNRFTITPQMGFILEQSFSFADKGSDLASFIINSYKVSNSLTIEFTLVFFNLAIDTEERDWVNRLRLLYSKNHWDVTLLAWHNNKVIDYDNSVYFSSGINVFYSRIKVTDHFFLSAGISGLMMAYTTNPTEYPKNNGLFLTVAGFLH
jgi:hypothetical protein